MTDFDGWASDINQASLDHVTRLRREAWQRGYDAGQADEFDAREGDEHENATNPFSDTDRSDMK